MAKGKSGFLKKGRPAGDILVSEGNIRRAQTVSVKSNTAIKANTK